MKSIMGKLVKIVLILALLSWAALGLRQASGQRGNQPTLRSQAVASLSSQPHEELTVATSDGSFVLKNLTLVKMTGSTVLKGNVVSRTNHKREQISFEVRAYDREGQLLKGLESETVFTAQGLKANASAPINHGYGVWLQGILTEKIARIEISETNSETASLPSWTKWLASHAMMREKDAEIEE